MPNPFDAFDETPAPAAPAAARAPRAVAAANPFDAFDGGDEAPLGDVVAAAPKRQVGRDAEGRMLAPSSFAPDNIVPGLIADVTRNATQGFPAQPKPLPFLEANLERAKARLTDAIAGGVRGVTEAVQAPFRALEETALGELVAPALGVTQPIVDATAEGSQLAAAQRAAGSVGSINPQNLDELAEQAMADPEGALRYLSGIGAESLPGILGAFVTRNPNAALALTGATTAGSTYGQQRLDGAGVDQAQQQALVSALLEVVGSKAPLDEALGAAVPLGRRLVTVPALEAGSEAGTGISQSVAGDIVAGREVDDDAALLQGALGALVGGPFGVPEALAGRGPGRAPAPSGGSAPTPAAPAAPIVPPAPVPTPEPDLATALGNLIAPAPPAAVPGGETPQASVPAAAPADTDLAAGLEALLADPKLAAALEAAVAAPSEAKAPAAPTGVGGSPVPAGVVSPTRRSGVEFVRNAGPRASTAALDAALDMDEDAYIAAVNPTGKRSGPEDEIAFAADDVDTPADAVLAPDLSFTDKQGRDVQVFEGPEGLYAQVDGKTVGLIESSNGETLNQVAKEFQGAGIGSGLARGQLLRDPMTPAGSFSDAGERTRRAALRQLRAERIEALGDAVPAPAAAAAAPAKAPAPEVKAPEPFIPGGKLYQSGKNTQAVELPDGTWRTRIRKKGQWQPWVSRETFDPSPAFGYQVKTPPGGYIDVDGQRVRLAPKEAPRAPAPQGPKKPSTALEALAFKGLDRAAWQAAGVDPAMFRKQFGIRYLFPKTGGLTPDGARELLQQEGFLPRDQDDRPAEVEDNDAIDVVLRGLNDDDTFSTDDGDALAAWQAFQQEGDEAWREETEAVLADLDDVDVPVAPEDMDEALAYAAQAAEREFNRMEARRGIDDEAEASDRQGREVGEDRPATRAQAGLFGAPTPRETVDAARRDRDAERDGRTGTGRTDMASGAGELFAGPRPAQTLIPEAPPRQSRSKAAALATLRGTAGGGSYPVNRIPYTKTGWDENAKWSDGDRLVTADQLAEWIANPESAPKAKEVLQGEATRLQPANRGLPTTQEVAGQLYAELNGRRFPVASYAEASEKFEAMRDTVDEGASATPTVKITDDSGKVVAHIAYNGRVFPGERWEPGVKALYEPEGEPLGRETIGGKFRPGEAVRLKNGKRVTVVEHSGQGRYRVKGPRGGESTVDYSDIAPESRSTRDPSKPRERLQQQDGTERSQMEADDEFDEAVDGARRNVNALRAAVSPKAQAIRQALGAAARHIEVLGSRDDLEPAVRRRLNPSERAEGVYDPVTGQVYVFADEVTTPERAVWVAFHETAGHVGLRGAALKLAGGNRSEAGRALVAALDQAASNPTVRMLRDTIMGQEDYPQALATEEALAELAAAVRTGNYAGIESRYGVRVPAGQRAGLRGDIERFLQAVRAFFQRVLGRDPGFTDAQVLQLLDDAWQYAQAAPAGETGRDGMRGAESRRESDPAAELDEEQVFDLLQEYGRNVDAMADAEKAWTSNDLVFINNEMADGDPYLAESLQQIRNTTTDRMMVVRREDFDAYSEENGIESRRPDEGPRTARSIIAAGRVLSLIDEANAAGADLTAVRDAYARKDGPALVRALDDLLLALKPAPQRLTGTMNAVTDAERAAAGKDPILRDAVKTNEAAVYEAMRTVSGDPLAGPEAVARLARGGVEGISLADEAVLLVHKTDLLNKREAAAKRLADPDASEAVKEAARAAWEAAEAQIAAVDVAAVNAGREWGRFGQFRQRMMQEDFTLAALERKERARLERPLTREESAKVREMAETIAGLQAKVDKLQAWIKASGSTRTYEALAKAVTRPAKKRPTLEALRQAANDARARLAATPDVPSRRGQSGAVLSPSVLLDYAVIGAFHIADGAAKFSDWVSAMRADLGEAFDRVKEQHPAIFKAAQKQLERPVSEGATPAEVVASIDPTELTARDVYRVAEAHVRAGLRGEDKVMAATHKSLEAEFEGITEREVRQLFSDYGNATFPSMEEAKVELRQLRSLVQMQESIERILDGMAPLRSGPQRDAMTQEVRAKRVQLNELLKTLAKDAKTPDQLRSYNDMRVRNLQNQIEDLEKQIATGERPEPKAKVEPSAEVQALIDRRDALVRERDAVNVGQRRNEAEKAALRKKIEAVEARIRGVVPAPRDPVQGVDDQETTNLRKQLEDLRARRNAVSAEVAAQEGIGKQIAELLQRLAGKEKPARPAEKPSSAAVTELRRIRDELAAQLRELERVPVDAEARYQEMRGKAIAKRIAELQQRIADGDFEPRPRIPRALNEANQRAQFELAKAKEEFARYQFEDQLRKRSPLGKAFGAVGDVFNLARAVMTSFDLSAPLRQGGFIVLGNPLRGLKGIAPMLRAFASEQAEFTAKAEIESRPNAPLYKKFGLELTGIGAGPLTQVEEAYASRWLNKLPAVIGGGLVRGSGRAYTSFLNRLRADSFDAMVASLARGKEPTEAEGKAIARYINVATGRGPIGGREKAGEVMNTVFFAPRLVASRFQLLAGMPMYGGSARTRRMIAKEYARFLTGVAVFMGLAAFALNDAEDDDDEPKISFDPRSASFGKIQSGNTFIDPLAGLAQVTTFLGRLITGETVSASGKVSPLRQWGTLTDLRRAMGEDIAAHELNPDGMLGFGESSAADVIGRFIRTKLAPVPGAIVNSLSGSNLLGEPVSPLDAAREMVTPMSFGDIAEAMEENGVPKGSALGLLVLFGMGVQTRNTENVLTATDTARADIKERLAQLPVDEWEGAMADMRKEYGPVMDGVSLAYYKRDGKYGNAGEPRRTADGMPVLETERLSNPAAANRNYRALLEAEGKTPAQITADLSRTAVHHIIPDNVVRQHPLMIQARTALGYDLDQSTNLIGLAKEKTQATEMGDELGHWTDHTFYDMAVADELDQAQQTLRRRHGLIERAPKQEVLDAIRKVEDGMRKKIKAQEVPKKDGRLASGMNQNQEGANRV